MAPYRVWKAILISAILLSAAHCKGMAVEPGNQRNVIFILVDDLGFMDLGCYNPHTFYETPNIDRLASQGMRFTAGYAACPVCSPTRASILTGKAPPRTGITDFIGGARTGKLQPASYRHQLALEEVTLAEAFQAANYATFFAGKWHLGDGNYSPSAQGFARTSLAAASSTILSIAPRSAERQRDDPKMTDTIADAAVRFISANRNRPFFAYLPFLAVHIPLGARPDLIAKYERKRQLAPADTWGTERQQRVRLVQNDPAYAAMVEQLDSSRRPCAHGPGTGRNRGSNNRCLHVR